MSDFIQRLISRTRGDIPLVEPLIAPRFSGEAADAGLTEIHAETDQNGRSEERVQKTQAQAQTTASSRSIAPDAASSTQAASLSAESTTAAIAPADTAAPGAASAPAGTIMRKAANTTGNSPSQSVSGQSAVVPAVGQFASDNSRDTDITAAPEFDIAPGKNTSGNEISNGPGKTKPTAPVMSETRGEIVEKAAASVLESTNKTLEPGHQGQSRRVDTSEVLVKETSTPTARADTAIEGGVFPKRSAVEETPKTASPVSSTGAIDSQDLSSVRSPSDSHDANRVAPPLSAKEPAFARTGRKDDAESPPVKTISVQNERLDAGSKDHTVPSHTAQKARTSDASISKEADRLVSSSISKARDTSREKALPASINARTSPETSTIASDRSNNARTLDASTSSASSGRPEPSVRRETNSLPKRNEPEANAIVHESESASAATRPEAKNAIVSNPPVESRARQPIVPPEIREKNQTAKDNAPIAPRAQSAAKEDVAARLARFAHPESRTESKIQVNIGRVEINAGDTEPASLPDITPAPARKPTISLEEYMKRRNGAAS